MAAIAAFFNADDGHLKAELQNLRRKGALRPSADWDSTGPDPDRSCGRCRVELGRVINRGAYCRACRLKVCKGCREYSLRTTDWVCTVCYKHMEIQAASGEWMNEFVRRPSRRRDNRVYVPAADIIKRTIRRSWTISNPTPHWNALRGSPELRPYNSLPRGQDINSYPSLALHKNKTHNQNESGAIVDDQTNTTASAQRHHSPCRRTVSEDVYSEPLTTPESMAATAEEALKNKRPIRVNPLTRFAETKASQKAGKSPRRKSQQLKGLADNNADREAKSEVAVEEKKAGSLAEKRVSFDCDVMNNAESMGEGNVGEKSVFRTQSLNEGSAVKGRKRVSLGPRSKTGHNDDSVGGGDSVPEVHFAKEEIQPVELCDIEPLSGTVFRKVTVRRRRQDMRKIPAVDAGWRRGPDSSSTADLVDILLPDGDDYKLVFISSDSSSKEEDIDDNDSSSTASSFPIDECDWDYFEPMNAAAPRLPNEVALQCVHREDAPRRQPCQSCGAPTQFIPIPVPVPIPFPILYDQQSLNARLRVVPARNLWHYMSQAGLIWPLLDAGAPNAASMPAMAERGAAAAIDDAVLSPSAHRNSDAVAASDALSGYVEAEARYASSSASSQCDSDEGNKPRVYRVYNVNESDDALPSSNATTTDGESVREDDLSSSGSADTDSDAGRKQRFSRTFVVNKNASSSSETSSDNDTDTEMDCTVVLTNVKHLGEEGGDKTLDVLESCMLEKVFDMDAAKGYGSSSPGLSDVSAESLHSSDVEQQATLDGDVPKVEKVLGEASEWKGRIRSGDGPVSAAVGGATNTRGEQRAGALMLVAAEPDVVARHAAARYTSLVMITQEHAPAPYQHVSVVTTDTTTLVPDNDVIVRHTNWQEDTCSDSQPADNQSQQGESVTVITGADTLSAFEEGLADDDSWVENLSHDEDELDSNSVTSTSGDEVTLTCSAAIDQEDELRGYHRGAIDFTLHTIVEESCEESEVESLPPHKDQKTLTTDLENYFFFRLGDGSAQSLNSNREETFSETSSLCSEGLDSLGGLEEATNPNESGDNMAELASSRLEKYFLHGFMGFTAENRRDSDGSVGSDSEGRPSPEQRRKRLVRARGTGRSHSSSLDNLLTNPDLGAIDQTMEVPNSEHSSSSDSDTYDELNTFERSDGQFDTVKRKKGKKPKNSDDLKALETTQEANEASNNSEDDDDGHKTPQPEQLTPLPSNLTTSKNQQSRDSGFIGSCDDLLKEQRENTTPELPVRHELKFELENIAEERKAAPLATPLTRKDSFNNWSSDEETNLMMCKMRQFFKTMVQTAESRPTTPIPSANSSPKPSPRVRNRCKPPQLVYFENELTRLMKTVPGIREDQVREIVEYLSSEDTWSDSYDSSDYTSSDLEGTTTKSALQQQISDSCKQIINKFDNGVDNEGDEGDGGIIDGLNRETAFVYQKLVASFEKMATGESETPPHNSPPLIAKVMHHIGSRLVALMHEVSSGESHASNSPKNRHYHRRVQQKLSSASTTEDDDSTSESNFFTERGLLPRSRSHDLLVGESRALHQSSVVDVAEERGEVSDCERFSWRGSFESALLATDSRNRLSVLGGEGSASALAIAAKRRSAGDLLFQSLSREQLDRVRSCGSIGGASSEDKLWVATRPTRRRSSVPDAACGSGGSADGEEDDEEEAAAAGGSRATLPRSLVAAAATTNSLPRLPTNAPTGSMQKAQSMHHFLPPSAKSARYRPPGFNRPITPKRAVSAPGLQQQQQPRRGRRSQQLNVPSDDVSISEAQSSPMLAARNGSKSATPSPIAPSSRRGTGSISSADWPNVNNEDDMDKFVMHHTRNSLSSLGLRSDSMASVYSGAGEGRYGTVTVRGQVEFGLQYNYKAKSLEIQIKQCKDLASVDVKRNRSDPYVKVYLLPDKSKSGKRKTKVKKHTLNPIFEETLKFNILLSGLETRTLWLTVWHSDMFGRNDFLGEVMMTLENKVFDDPTPKWYNLQERTEPFDDMLSFKGDIIVCLKFVPPDMTVQKKGKRSRGTLHVMVKEAKSLTAVKANGTSDPFCKSYLLPEKGRSSKQKTPVAKRTVNPVWNHTFVYDDVTLQELAERCLELTVWDHDRLASNEFLGGVRFSLGTGKHYGKAVDWMDATGKEHSLWKSMLERPNFWVEGCLSLRPSLDTRAS